MAKNITNGFNFTRSAQETNSNSILQVGRDKIQWKELDGKPVTIIKVDRNEGPDFDRTTGNIKVNSETGEVETKMYTTVWLKEYPDKFAGGFGALDRTIDKWAENFETLDDLNDALEKFGGVKITTNIPPKSDARKITVLD